MSNKTEATFHGASLGSMQGTPPAWDRLDEYSDTVLSKSDVRTALDTLGGVFDEAALRTLTTKQLTCLTTASHAKPEGQHRAEIAAIQAYQDARRRVATGAETAMTEAEVAEAMVYEPQQETIGDWAGHTPAINEQIKLGQRDLDFDAAMAEHHAEHVEAGLRSLIKLSGENSRDHGFHDDWPVDIDLIDPGADRDYQKAIVEKLALIHEEISESLGEIRSGRDPLEIYFVDKKGHAGGPEGFEYTKQYYGLPGTNRHPEEVPCREGDVPLLKPEGFLVELADAVIRIADLVFLVDGREQFIKARATKHEYNTSREHKHGRKF